MSTIGSKKEKNHTVLTIIKWGLLLFTMVRSIDLFWWSFEGMGTLQLLSIAGIFGLDLALMAWDDYTAHKYETMTQRTVGLIMIIINIIGIGAAVIADTARAIGGPDYKQLVMYVAMFGLPLMIMINLVGLIVIKQLDPDEQIAQQDRYAKRMQEKEERDHARDLEFQRRAHSRELEKLGMSSALQKEMQSFRKQLGIDSGGSTATTMAADGRPLGDPKVKKE